MSEDNNLGVKRAVDIWSLGCVYSEVAVWLCHGWKRVEEYRRQRAEEVRRKIPDGSGNLFHDGNEVLDAVGNAHSDIERTRAYGKCDDHITAKVIDELVADMILEDPGSRFHAQQLMKKSERMIQNAGESFGAHENDRLDKGPKLPPQLPPSRRHTMLPYHAPEIDYSTAAQSSRRQSLARQSLISQDEIPLTSPILNPRVPLSLNTQILPSLNIHRLSSEIQNLTPAAYKLSSRSPTRNHNARSVPSLSIEQGLKIKKREVSFGKQSWPGEDNLADLDKRDHVSLAIQI